MSINTITKHKNTKTKLEKNIYGWKQSEKATGKSYMKPYRERTTNDFCEHWYYSKVSYIQSVRSRFGTALLLACRRSTCTAVGQLQR